MSALAAFFQTTISRKPTEYLLEFIGLSQYYLEGDNTAFVDYIEVLDSNDNPVAGAIQNGSFEQPAGVTYSYTLTFAETKWNFIYGGTGIAGYGSAFSPPQPSYGYQVAFVQGSAQMNQLLTLAPGVYKIRFYAAQRGSNNQRFNVRVNNNDLGNYVPSISYYGAFTTPTFTVY